MTNQYTMLKPNDTYIYDDYIHMQMEIKRYNTVATKASSVAPSLS